VTREFIASIEAEFGRYKALGEAAIDQLEVEDLNVTSVGENSITTLVWHISGNLKSRFTDFLTADGEKTWRDRDSEFQGRSASVAEVQEKWEDGWTTLLRTLEPLTDDDLSAEVSIRGVALTVPEALHRSLAHASYHVGQIVLIARSLRGGDWKFLSISPGGSAAYNRDPAYEKARDHAARVEST